jgi:hypothetical protein
MRAANYFSVIFSLLLPLLALAGSRDSTFFSRNAGKQREVRNYIRPCLYVDNFSTGTQRLRSTQTGLTSKLGDYRFGQTNIGFYTPLWTKTSNGKKDTNDVNTFHLLFTMNALGVRPDFSGFEKQHRLYKTGVGLRGIWAFRSRCIIFADIFPFVTGDRYDNQNTQTLRVGGSFVFNYMYTPKFSWRVGITKNFLFGNRWFMPMAGFRYGKLDGKCYFTMQLPRFISVYFQPNPKLTWSIYSRAFGGLYNLSNKDSVYTGQVDETFQMGHTGIANGVRFDVRPNPNFSFYVSTGFAMQNHIWFYSYYFNQANDLPPLRPFYKASPTPTVFLHFGISWRFGQAKKSTGNYLMYDVFDLNNTMDPGDNNSGPGNQNITPRYDKNQMKNLQYRDVVDLVDETDLY